MIPFPLASNRSSAFENLLQFKSLLRSKASIDIFQSQLVTGQVNVV